MGKRLIPAAGLLAALLLSGTRASADTPAVGAAVLAGCYGNMVAGVVERAEPARVWVRFTDPRGEGCDGWRDADRVKPASVAPAARAAMPAGLPPDGTYPCAKISPGGLLIGVGSLDIRGATYRGLEGGGGYSPLRAEGNLLTLTAGLRGMPKGWQILRAESSADGSGRPLVRIFYRSSAGFDDAIDCVRE